MNRFDGAQIFTVTRKGDGLQAQMTGQPGVEIFPESETAFFYKLVDAQLEFTSNGGPATAVTLTQGGGSFTMPRIDEAMRAQIAAELEARIASDLPAPGSEAAVRKMVEGIAAGSPNYDDMEKPLADATRSQMGHLKPAMDRLGAIKSIEFQRVGDGGWDVYRVRYANGTLLWRIGLAPNGKTSYAVVLPDA